ncbi:MAG TPA: 50S ribosomal protein L17 [Patescibacteria group bacterium]|jgi:large subunit ribosomal protein L17|nr:50S ribosomal protein L17 [bacterium]HRT11096.1 50S ribosomal protein L17 [Patescibacteria group bacterium]HRU89947.1 50S ribosomal protein L17 [Patescibacteria group bacterium]
MRHRNKGVILDRAKEPREMMLRNLAASILMHEFVVTTKAKAKAVQPLVEHVLTIAKAGDLAARRRLIAILPQDKAVSKALELAKRYESRNGGYTRIISLGCRQGDGAQQVRLELV